MARMGADGGIPPLEIIRAIREIRGELLPHLSDRDFRRGFKVTTKGAKNAKDYEPFPLKILACFAVTPLRSF